MNDNFVTYLTFFSDMENQVKDLYDKKYEIKELYNMYDSWLKTKSYYTECTEPELDTKAKITMLYYDKIRIRNDNIKYETESLKKKLFNTLNDLQKTRDDRDYWMKELVKWENEHEQYEVLCALNKEIKARACVEKLNEVQSIAYLNELLTIGFDITKVKPENMKTMIENWRAEYVATKLKDLDEVS